MALRNLSARSRSIHILLGLLVTLTPSSTATAQEIVDNWRYTLRRPAQGWRAAGFDDSNWKEGFGGFGMRDTPGSRVGTIWGSNNIWLRKTFELKEIPAKPALLIHHDEDTEVFINGQNVIELDGYITGYKVIPIPEDKQNALKAGKNVMAVHCRQTGGGQFIDVHVVDADNVPKLPEPQRSTKPFESELITKWGEQVTPENAWTEYPRPQLQRDNWQNLNGRWDYAITPVEQTDKPDKWDGQILVPYCLESKLGGVQRLLDSTEALWYRRTFKTEKSDDRTLLNFEAVDYRCEAFVNGQSVGRHQGGNTPFSFDITQAVKDGENELVVRVQDETEKFQLRGKQTLNPRGIWYTQVSGIWQTVWLEQVPESYFKDLKITTDAASGTITVKPVTNTNTGFEVIVKDGDKIVARGQDSDQVELKIENAKLWSHESPFLYDLEVTVLNATGPMDRIKSYTGIRDVGKARGPDGNWRFTLNGKPVFHWGPLDQGWWPDGLLTPPSDEAMQFEIGWLKEAGFNMIRKHIKVEPRRYYYHCDKLGMMVWQDHVSGGPQPRWTRLAPNPQDADWPDAQHAQFMKELGWMIDSLENHPSIVCWVPFNEAWGQHRTVEVGKWVQERDPSRLINIASGGNFWPVGDIVDAHSYPNPQFPFQQGENGRFDGYIKVMGEFGGHGYPVRDHLWDADRRNWGYGGLPQNKEEYKERYVTSLNMLNDLRGRGIAAGVYTQTTDVEGEINGLMTYDRKVIKIPAKELADLHKKLFEEPPSQTSARPNSSLQDDVSARTPGPVMDPDTIRDGLKSHDRALFIKTGWIRDPYIVRGPDGDYYLTGTTPNPGDPREASDPYNTGLGPESIVGYKLRLWRSKDLIDWEDLGTPFTLLDGYWAKKLPQRFEGDDRTSWHLWAPEVHFFDGKWHIVHTTPAPVRRGSNLAVTEGKKIEGPYSFPLGDLSRGRHDPSLFVDSDDTVYLLWGNTMIVPLTEDLSGFAAEPVRIDPAGSRPGPDGTPISRIGHEGATMRKIGDQYVHFGTAWSTDQGRKGSYNLYYSVADNITGPYGPRKFAGRFLGHGTPFQDKDGRWWCTAFFNANVPPLPRDEIESRDLRENAQTINEQGVTLVPLEVKVLDDGDIFIRAKDPAYAAPGPDEAQQFNE